MRNLLIIAYIMVPLSVLSILIFRQNIYSSHCLPGFFRLTGMNSCHPWLSCVEFKNIIVKELIGFGAVKSVYRAIWKNYSIAYSKLSNRDYLDDFKHGLNMLKIFNHSPYVVQLIGFCEEENVILTEYYRNGNAINVTSLLPSSNLDLRLKLCLNYAMIVEYLHNSPAGTRVMCDSNDIVKLLSQFLVSDDLSLVMNDLDALPEVDRKMNRTIKCGHRQLTGTFIAPEQLWPLPGSFVDSEMPGYDEKTDIWKAASVCDHFLGNVTNSDMVRYRLFSLHKSCKHRNPEERPTATHLVKEYMKVLEELDNII